MKIPEGAEDIWRAVWQEPRWPPGHEIIGKTGKAFYYYKQSTSCGRLLEARIEWEWYWFGDIGTIWYFIIQLFFSNLVKGWCLISKENLSNNFDIDLGDNMVSFWNMISFDFHKFWYWHLIKQGERYEGRAHQPNGDEMESKDDIHSCVPVPEGGKHLEHIVN